MLGVTAGPIADDADEPICPKEMLKFITGHEEVFGDFEVCPFTRKHTGHMQMVCVESVKNTVVKRPASNPTHPPTRPSPDSAATLNK
jgi:hypothetical protein